MWRVFLKRGEFRGATIGVFEAEGGYPRLFEESPSPQLAAEQTGDNRRFCVLVKFTFRADPLQKAFRGTLLFEVNFTATDNPLAEVPLGPVGQSRPSSTRPREIHLPSARRCQMRRCAMGL